jgi:predicted dehydrogenase
MATGEAATLVVVGAGQRGTRYAELALQQGARVVAVADPEPIRRERLAALAGLPPERCYRDWVDLAAMGRLAAGAVVATPDHLHREPAVALLGLGYDVLLEKPMAPDAAGARQIVAAADASDSHLVVAHVLRYQPITRLVESLLGDGGIGEVISVQHLEPIGDWHFTHSYVRGNWRNERESGPLLLTKACHDIDWLSHIVGSRALRVSSFGGRFEFRPERAPAGAGERCLDCAVEADCPFSAKRQYLGALDRPDPWAWPVGVVTDIHTREALEAALWSGPYGRCVYRCDNDVLDHQVVNVEYESGVVASFMLSAFTPMGGRKTRIGGSRGHLETSDGGVQVYRFLDRSVETLAPLGLAGDGSPADGGHAGGDEGLVRAFVAALADGEWSRVPTDGHASLRSHLLVWAAEEARLGSRVVQIAE